MPCRNDYDPPSQAQQANRVAARLLIVLNNKQNHLSSTQLLVDSTNTYLETDYVKVLCERLTEMFKKALHGISLASQNSSSKEECGRIASKALEEARQWRIKATDEQQAQGADRPVPSAVLKDSLNKILDASVAQQITDAAYTERNHLVALLSKIYPAGKARTAIEGWSPEWHGCVYIDFPWGQASWHYHDRDAGLFNHLEPYRGSWDGHTTEAKYELIRQVVVVPQEQANMGPGRHWWPVSKGHADNVCAAAPQQAEPVAQIGWADEFGNLFPMAAWKPAQRTHHDAHKTAWRPVFLHPPAAEVQRLRDALEQIEREANQPYIQRIAAAALKVGE